MKKRYFLYCSYKGTNYCGWQVQPNGVSVQEVLTKALQTILRDENLEIVGAGRTDTGVHAKMMSAHFDAEIISSSLNDLLAKLNSFLPADVAVHRITEVRPDAHARFNALSRRYEYRIVLEKNAFKTDFTARLFHSLNFDSMNEAASALLEYLDFTSFSKLHTDVKTNNCTITYAKWEKQADEWVFTIEADRFLRNMVRAIVGTLIEVGREKINLNDFRKIIEAKDRCKAGTSAPAQGLFLVEVKYPEEIFITT